MILVTGGPGMIGARTAGALTGPGQDPYLDVTRLINDTGFGPPFDVAAAIADCAARRADNSR